MTPAHALEQPLEAIVARDNLQRAWRRVKANKGAAGIDAVSVTDFPAWARQHWPTIKAQWVNGDYQPEAVRRVWIPKPNGDKRPLGIPTVSDRIRKPGHRATTRATVRARIQRPKLRVPSESKRAPSRATGA